MIDKTNWPDGPWKKEPDEYDFMYKDYECCIRRGPRGTLNGYVIIPNDHPSFSKELDIKVHGGITYDEKGKERKLGKKVRIIGFDTAHSEDIVPVKLVPKEQLCIDLHDLFFGGSEEEPTYKDMEFVQNQIKKMVDQLGEY